MSDRQPRAKHPVVWGQVGGGPLHRAVRQSGSTSTTSSQSFLCPGTAWEPTTTSVFDRWQRYIKHVPSVEKTFQQKRLCLGSLRHISNRPGYFSGCKKAFTEQHTRLSGVSLSWTGQTRTHGRTRYTGVKTLGADAECRPPWQSCSAGTIAPFADGKTEVQSPCP